MWRRSASVQQIQEVRLHVARPAVIEQWQLIAQRLTINSLLLYHLKLWNSPLLPQCSEHKQMLYIHLWPLFLCGGWV
jgi:hypothetical protein